MVNMGAVRENMFKQMKSILTKENILNLILAVQSSRIQQRQLAADPEPNCLKMERQPVQPSVEKVTLIMTLVGMWELCTDRTTSPVLNAGRK